MTRTFAISILLLMPVLAQPQGSAGYHKLRLDSRGQILPWYGNSPAEGYDHAIRLVWQFWRNMKPCVNGVPYYLQHQVWQPGADDDSRGLGADQIPMAMSSWALLYNYLGDPALIDNMKLMADYWLAHGMSKAEDRWANLPFPYNADPHSGTYDGDRQAGKNFLQPDKAGSFGYELVGLYKITGDRKYLNAAIAIADTLSRRARPGDAERSPWPFRVNATTGEIHSEYSTNWTPTIQLFEELAALDAPNRGGYLRVAGNAWEWLVQHPVRQTMKEVRPKWGPFFDDVPPGTWSDTSINAGTLGQFLFLKPDRMPAAELAMEEILKWTERTLGNHDFDTYGATVIDEQTSRRLPGQSHTVRHAALEIMFGQLSTRQGRKEQAIRRLNWATYTVDVDGKNRNPQGEIRLTDGYGDYVRHYLRAMSAAPELAPDDQNHLLSTSSTIQQIRYEPRRVTYRKFDDDSRELIKFGAGTPTKVANGLLLKWDEKTRVALIVSSGKNVTITLK